MADYLIGKGMLVWIISRCAGGDPLRLAQMAVQAGLDWVALKVHDGAGDYNGDLRPHADALRAAGVTVWAWGYCYGFNVAGEAATIIRRVPQIGAVGYLLNAEKEWKQPGMGVRAKFLVNELRVRLPGVPVGLCSYRYPTFHKQFPWMEFLSGSDFHCPQVYWLENDDPSAPAVQLGRSLSELRALADLPVVPLGVASPNDTGTWWPSVAQLDNFYAAVQARGLTGWGWWEWGHAERKPEFWQAISAHGEVPAPPALTIPALADEIAVAAGATALYAAMLKELG